MVRYRIITSVAYVRFCTHCRNQVDENRAIRGSNFCSDDCREADRKERRALLASRSCRLCHRKIRKPKTTTELPTIDFEGCALGAQPIAEGDAIAHLDPGCA
jgi:hypothetical protein